LYVRSREGAFEGLLCFALLLIHNCRFLNPQKRDVNRDRFPFTAGAAAWDKSARLAAIRFCSHIPILDLVVLCLKTISLLSTRKKQSLA
jgi:hypothetical protein